MRNLFAQTAIGLMGLLTIGTGTGRAQGERGDRVPLRSTSPFAIASAVNHSRRMWIKHRIELGVDLGDTWGKLGIEPGDFGVCGAGCEATVDKHDLDPAPGREVILKLSQSSYSCRFLLFVRAKDTARAKLRWKLRGYVDHDFNRYEMARHRVVHAFGKNWLVIRGQEGSGSGYSLYGETWFESSKSGLRPVLHYSVEGHTYPGLGGLNWELKSQAVALNGGRSHERTIRVDFVVLYNAHGFEDSDFTSRFTNRRHAYYFWNRQTREFVFAGNGSTISEREMDLVANVETEEPTAEEPGVKIGGSTFYSGLKGFVGSGFEMFLRLNSLRLMKIAKGPEGRSKEWLRQFLQQCDDITEKLALEKALRARLPHSQKQR